MTSGAVGVVMVLLAAVLHQRRRLSLRVERIGDRSRLVIDRAGVVLDFPITCHGKQFESRVGRVPINEVYLQLVDANRRAILLHETRGAIYGPQEAWFKDDVDRSVASPLFDVSGAGVLAKVRDWVSGK
jgi:hypothetical protein